MTQTAFDNSSLFEPGPLPGLGHYPDYIGEAEAAACIDFIDRQPWSCELLRRRQWYGWAYDDSLYGGADEYRPQPMPDCLAGLAKRLHGDGYFAGVPDRVLVNEYFPGQGIGAHKDRDSEHIAAVAILSLGSAIMMDFTRFGHATRSYYLRPRSLVIMRGEARTRWMHGIVGRKTDRVGGLVVPRGRRLSLTFRYAARDDSLAPRDGAESG